MLACDLIGFHVQFHCNNFLETANRLLESRIDTEKFTVNRGGRQTYVRPYPISVNGYSSNNDDYSQQIQEIKDVTVHRFF
jgi:trehalose-6-phosphate synthase